MHRAEEHRRIEGWRGRTAHRGDEDGGGGLVEEHEGEAAGEVGEHEAGGVRRPVPQRPVGLDHQHRLVGALRQPVLLPEAPQVGQQPLEQAVDLVLRREQPNQSTKQLQITVSTARIH